MAKAKRKRSAAPRHGNRRLWTPQEVALLGQIADAQVAALLQIARRTVLKERQRRGIACAHPKHRPHRARARD